MIDRSGRVHVHQDASAQSKWTCSKTGSGKYCSHRFRCPVLSNRAALSTLSHSERPMCVDIALKRPQLTEVHEVGSRYTAAVCAHL